MRGEGIVVLRPATTSTDPYNAPVTEWVREPVSNVLVAPGSLSDLGAERPEGVEVRYTLCLPKTFEGPLEGCKVEVRGEVLDVVGHPDRFDPCPTEWDMVCEIGGTHG